MVKSMRVNTSLTKRMVMEYIHGLMVGDTVDIGLKADKMVWAVIMKLRKIHKNMVFGKTEKK